MAYTDLEYASSPISIISIIASRIAKQLSDF